MSAKKSPQQQREYKLSDGTDMVEYQNKTKWEFTRCCLNDSDIELIGRLLPKANVTQLYLQGNKIQNISALKNSMPNVTTLVLDRNQIQDISALKDSMPNVTELELHRNQIEDISALKDSMPNVIWFRLAGNLIPRSSIVELEAHWKSLGKDERYLTF